MIAVSLDGGRLVFGDIPYRLRDEMKEIPGAKFRDGHWTAPISWPTCAVVNKILTDVQFSNDVHAWLWTEHRTRIEPALTARKLAMDPSESVPSAVEGLYPYQTTGSAFLANAGAAGCFDDPGTGKTVQAITALEELPDAYPVLVVCPKTAKATWSREFARWAPHRDVVRIDGGAGLRRKLLEEEHDSSALVISSRLQWVTCAFVFGSARRRPGV